MARVRKQEPSRSKVDEIKPSPSSAPCRSRGKLWLFRVSAAVLSPVIFFLLLELVLRLIGFGYPTGFLLSSEAAGKKVFAQNNQFGWRFFGRDLARWPYPFSIPQVKSTNTVRILVLGESAARGEPQPDFGLPRLLQTMLTARYPNVRFEVVNAAMTAINSHAILPIARDCKQAQADIWVIYMGNNEVVGPFGAGTIFGSQSPPLALIRATLAAKATRSGQLMDSLLQGLRSAPDSNETWGGMTMFQNEQVRQDDPRMNSVYQHFERNLSDIIRIGQGSGAGIVLSTVAVNLKDCPPFASLHRSTLSEADKSKWEELFSSGADALRAGKFKEAEANFRDAAAIDDTFAELRFRQGQCALARTNVEAARQHFQAARDLDTLRFRCDGRLNELIRQTSTNFASDRVLLADAERSLARWSGDDLPGEKYFYEHVHPTFYGNYLIASAIAEQVRKLLPEQFTQHDDSSRIWPSPTTCSDRLGRSAWHEVAALNSIITTLNDQPFSSQLDHETRMQRLEAELASKSGAATPEGIAEAITIAETALKSSPNDPILYRQIATLKRAASDFAGATIAARREMALLPGDSEGWALLGSILTQQQQSDEAAIVFRHAFRLGPQGIKSHLDLANSLFALGAKADAIREYERILAQKPRYVPALLQIGHAMETLGRSADAQEYFSQALTNRSQRLPELVELGQFFQRREEFDAASQVYLDAVKLSPTNARLRLSAAQTLASMGRYDAALPHAVEAVRAAPDFVEARLMYGIVLWKLNRGVEAEKQFEAALQLQPDSVDAHLNLGMVWVQQGQRQKALGMFEWVLERTPSNALALKFAQPLRSGHTTQPSSGVK